MWRLQRIKDAKESPKITNDEESIEKENPPI